MRAETSACLLGRGIASLPGGRGAPFQYAAREALWLSHLAFQRVLQALRRSLCPAGHWHASQ